MDKRKYQQTGLYANRNANDLDGRTSTAKVIRELQQELLAYVGGKPSIAAQILINRIVYATIRLSKYENVQIENPDANELPHYMPMVNSLRRSLEVLMEMAGEKSSTENDDKVRAWLRSKSLEELKELRAKIRERAIDNAIAEKSDKSVVDS